MSPKPAQPRARRPKGIQGRLKAHDPFELIRWLAFSQTDPRKALAELVQNSLDAGAHAIHVTRFRHKGACCLRITDDGEGVIPEMDRAEALRYVATHIGHSRKRSLSPQERLALMTQGQYGIGLLGFWSLGEQLEMRSSLPGQRPHRLVLFRDDAKYRIEPLPGRLALDERRTEILVSGVHAEAQRVLAARRASEYLAAELRGQLLSRDVRLTLEDRIARGRGMKNVAVRPPRFLGERIRELDRVEVPGYPPLKLEVYWCGERDGGGDGISVYGAGTQVADSFAALSSLGLDRLPWTDDRLTGLVDFPALRIAPGSRRGVIVDEAAEAFARGLAAVEPVLEAVLLRMEERRAEELEKSLVRDLQRAFRDFHRNRPRYSMLPVQAPKDAGEDGAGDAPGSGIPAGDEDGERDAGGADEQLPLLPPGPLAALRARPGVLRVPPGETRHVRIAAVDASGRAVEEVVSFRWITDGAIGEVTADDPPVRAAGTVRLRLDAASDYADGALHVFASAASGEAQLEIPVFLTDEDRASGADEGIPEPALVDAPGERWRSRMLEGAWQVNSAHRDFTSLAERPAVKLRYLAMLFAKEVVLHDVQDPRLAAPLEQLVEIAVYADRKLATGRKRAVRRERGPEG